MIQKISTSACYSGLAIFCAGVLTMNDFKDLGLYLLVLLMFLSIRNVYPYWKNADQQTKLIGIAFIVFSVWCYISYALHGVEGTRGAYRLETYATFILVVLFLPALASLPKLNSKWIAAAFSIGAIVTFSVALYQMLGVYDIIQIDEMKYRRAYGDTHPNRYGGIAMSLGLICIGYGFFGNFTKIFKATLFFCGILGIAASVASSTRGSWIALPPGILIFIYYATRHSINKKYLAFSVIAILTLSIGAIYAFKLDYRIKSSITNVQKFFDADEESRHLKITSVGLRLEMFRSSLFIIKENPIFGVGVGNFTPAVQNYAERHPEARIEPATFKFSNPHNEFLFSWAERGLIGFVTLLSVLLLPVLAFIKNHQKYQTPESIIGIVFVVCYSIVGLSICLFHHKEFMHFYIVVICFFLAASAQKTNLDPQLKKAA